MQDKRWKKMSGNIANQMPVESWLTEHSDQKQPLKKHKGLLWCGSVAAGTDETMKYNPGNPL